MRLFTTGRLDPRFVLGMTTFIQGQCREPAPHIQRRTGWRRPRAHQTALPRSGTPIACGPWLEVPGDCGPPRTPLGVGTQSRCSRSNPVSARKRATSAVRGQGRNRSIMTVGLSPLSRPNGAALRWT